MLRLHEKGGKQHAMPCHHNLERTCMNIVPARPRERSQTYSRGNQLTGNALGRRRICDDDSAARQSREPRLRLVWLAPLKNCGTLEKTAQMANHFARRWPTIDAPRRSRSTRLREF